MEEQWASPGVFSGCRITGWTLKSRFEAGTFVAVLEGRKGRLTQPEWMRIRIKRRRKPCTLAGASRSLADPKLKGPDIRVRALTSTSSVLGNMRQIETILADKAKVHLGGFPAAPKKEK